MPKSAVVSLSTCESCRVEAPTVFVSLSQTKAALVVRWENHLDAPLCSSCLTYHFRRFTLTNLTLGWWGPFSVFLAPVYSVQNLWAYARARRAFRQAVLDRPGQIQPL